MQYTVSNSTRLRHKSDKRMAKIITKVGEIFHEEDEFYLPLSVEVYRDLMLQAQEPLNQNEKFSQAIMAEIEKRFFNIYRQIAS